MAETLFFEEYLGSYSDDLSGARIRSKNKDQSVVSNLSNSSFTLILKIKHFLQTSQ